MNGFPTRPLAVLLAAAILVACATATDTEAPEPELGPIPTITHPSQVQRPIRVFIPTVDDVRGIRAAQEALTKKCLRDKGIEPVEFVRNPAEDALAESQTKADGEYSPLWGYFRPDEDDDPVVKAHTAGRLRNHR